MSQFQDPQADPIEEPQSSVTPSESADESSGASAQEILPTQEGALASRATSELAQESEPPEPEPEEDEDEDLTITEGMHPDLQLLRTQQQYALQELAEGKTVAQAARTAMVDRSTVFRWMKRDQAFMIALAAWRSRARRGARDRLLSMSDKAMQCLDGALDERSLPAALAVLKGLGLLDRKAGAGKSASPGRPERGPSASVRKKMIMELREMLLTIELPSQRPMRKRIESAPSAQPPQTPPPQKPD